MLKMSILLALLFFLCSSGKLKETECSVSSILTLNRHDSSYVDPVQTIGVSVEEEKLNQVSNSILMAENWLRTHVLSRYPSSNVNSIVVANDLLCNEKIRNREELVRLTLDAMKNMYYSLTRWGLQREIKVSVSLSFNCLHQSHLQKVFSFLEDINSTYTINTPQFSDQTLRLLTSEPKSMKDLGVFQSETVNVIFPMSKQAKPTSRKLQFLDPLWFPPTPPSQAVEFPPATFTLPFPPETQPPTMAPASSPSPHHMFNLPPCNPYPHFYRAAPPIVGNGGGRMAAPPTAGKSMAAPPASGGDYGQEGMWCVAKPSVPSEKLQVAMDYACGPGGADCDPIKPNGSCYSPDSVVAHASYAFNSYWQKNKKNGGICGFEGTAMLITSDPSKASFLISIFDF
uniref:X8 domain-containing protein n=1 Tax=Lactuca sativa TaxID=4236 RepID=A0A9R1VXA6_LACSA|nr:hypothetical protein LSAT_V11C400219290 [Lactuca sativa]